MPTLTLLKNAGARIILISHHDGKENTQSISSVAQYFTAHGISCGFLPDTTGEIVTDVLQHLGEGTFALLQNLRRNPGEMGNDEDFARALASYADIFVNDAFSVSHRNHASIIGIPKYVPSYLGLNFEKEITALEPLVSEREGLGIIIGGAKFATKLDLMKKFLANGIPVFLGGALAHAIYKEREYEIGKSLCDIEAHVADISASPLLVVPEYVLAADAAGKIQEKNIHDVLPDDRIVDMGPSSILALQEFLKDKKMILWNGPLGWYEGGYTAGSIACANLLSNTPITNGDKKIKSIIGGGDTITMLNQANIPLNNFHFVSTGGGALLDYLIHGNLPGIEAARESKK
jgi:phosphoglycerate kinase